MDTQTLKLSQIRIDGGTQPRVEINQEVVADYADQLRSGEEFPPVTVFFDGAAYWLADGFHRYHAHRSAGRDTIVTDIQDGGLREAILYSVGANSEHGLRRTNEDKRRAVETMLVNEVVSKDENGNPWSNCDIARQCNVSEFLVRRCRESLTSIKSKYESDQRAFTHPKTGKPSVMNTTKIGLHKRPTLPKGTGQSTVSEKYTTIDLPGSPQAAARTLLGSLGEDLAVKIAEEVLLIVTSRNSDRLRIEK